MRAHCAHTHKMHFVCALIFSETNTPLLYKKLGTRSKFCRCVVSTHTHNAPLSNFWTPPPPDTQKIVTTSPLGFLKLCFVNITQLAIKNPVSRAPPAAAAAPPLHQGGIANRIVCFTNEHLNTRGGWRPLATVSQ